MAAKARRVTGEKRYDVRKYQDTVTLTRSMSEGHRKRVVGRWRDIRSAIKRSGKVGVDTMVQVWSTSAEGLPYAHNPPPRIDTGAMRSDMKMRITVDTKDRFAIAVGWPDVKKEYYSVQDMGYMPGGPRGHWKFRPMKAREAARQRMKEEMHRRLRGG